MTVERQGEVNSSVQKEDTIQVFCESVKHTDTAAIESNSISTEEAMQMKTWLMTGITPDGTRMMTGESCQWYQDFYQGTLKDNLKKEAFPEGSLVDYSYWNCPYIGVLGEIKLVMMHAQVNCDYGTRMPADRFRAKTKAIQNFKNIVEKTAR